MDWTIIDAQNLPPTTFTGVLVLCGQFSDDAQSISVFTENVHNIQAIIDSLHYFAPHPVTGEVERVTVTHFLLADFPTPVVLP
jgi:hypothetical protein